VNKVHLRTACAHLHCACRSC